jgi:hypothetical protein
LHKGFAKTDKVGTYTPAYCRISDAVSLLDERPKQAEKNISRRGAHLPILVEQDTTQVARLHCAF